MGIMKKFRCEITGKVIEKASRNCTICRDWKPLGEFGKSKNGKYGRKSQCRLCLAKKERERYSKDKRKVWNVEEIKKYNAELAEKNAKNPEDIEAKPDNSWKTLGIPKDYTCPITNITRKNVRSRMCNSCYTWKPLEEFSKQKTGRYGRKAECKECLKNKERKRKLLKERENNESKN